MLKKIIVSVEKGDLCHILVILIIPLWGQDQRGPDHHALQLAVTVMTSM